MRINIHLIAVVVLCLFVSLATWTRDKTRLLPHYQGRKIPHFGECFCLAFLFLGLLAPHLANAQADTRPIVVLREDDVRSSWRRSFAELGGKTPLAYGKEKQIPITWAVVTDAANAGWGLTWAQLFDYVQTTGGELASHSCKHTPMSTTSEYVRELTESKDIINAQLAQHWPGHYCTTFIQPGPWMDDANLDHFSELDNPIGQAIQATYLQSRAYLGSGWHVGNITYRYGTTADYSLDFDASCPDKTPAVLATLDIVANTPGLIIVFMCHGVQSSTGTEGYAVRANLLRAFMDRVAELRDAGKVRVMGIHDAHQTTLSSDLNHAVDPGFELCDPGPNNPKGPVFWSTGCSIETTGGIDNSKYLSIPRGRMARNESRLDPGRYRLSWWQKPTNPSGGKLSVLLMTANPQWIWWHPMSYTLYTQTDPNAWERKEALAIVRYGYPTAFFNFAPCADASFGVDNISIVREDLDPAESPMNSTITPTPTTCTISWDTPNNANVTSIRICRRSDTYPLTPSDGTVVGEVAAVPAARQQLVIDPMNWPSQGYMYFSVFGLKGGPATYTPPDLVAVCVTGAAPQVSALVQPDRSVVGSWSCTSDTPVWAYKYCVGRSSCVSDVVQWTTTTNTSATISDLPINVTLNLSAKAQNIYGNWSNCAYATFLLPESTISIGQALTREDNTHVTVSGVISAVFHDYYYIASADNYRGLRIIGHTNRHEGESVSSLNGTMTTVSGERALIPDPGQ